MVDQIDSRLSSNVKKASSWESNPDFITICLRAVPFSKTFLGKAEMRGKMISRQITKEKAVEY